MDIPYLWQKNSILITKKVVKISFVCEQFSLLGKNEKIMFLSFSDYSIYYSIYSIQTVLRPGSTIICPASIIPVIRMQSLSGTTRRTHKIWGTASHLSKQLRQLLFRATKKIKAGQEITATYLDLEDGLNRVYRQVKKHWTFNRR